MMPGTEYFQNSSHNLGAVVVSFRKFDAGQVGTQHSGAGWHYEFTATPNEFDEFQAPLSFEDIDLE